jgi:hypothetical protein
MPDDFPERYEWQLDGQAEQTLRAGLHEVVPALRGELWWWMDQRGKPAFEDWLAEPAKHDPGADVLVDAIRDNPKPAYRRANWALATYVLLTGEFRADEWLWASSIDEPSIGVDYALHDMKLPSTWERTLVGGAVSAVGIAGRIEP